jgi:hypothetical protein
VVFKETGMPDHIRILIAVLLTCAAVLVLPVDLRTLADLAAVGTFIVVLIQLGRGDFPGIG